MRWEELCYKKNQFSIIPMRGIILSYTYMRKFLGRAQTVWYRSSVIKTDFSYHKSMGILFFNLSWERSAAHKKKTVWYGVSFLVFLYHSWARTITKHVILSLTTLCTRSRTNYFTYWSWPLNLVITRTAIWRWAWLFWDGPENDFWDEPENRIILQDFGTVPKIEERGQVLRGQALQVQGY